MKKMIVRATTVVAFLIVAFLWGLATGRWESFPFEIARTVYRTARPPPPLVLPALPEAATELRAAPGHILADTEANAMRRQLRAYLIDTVDVRTERVTPDEALQLIKEGAAQQTLKSVSEVIVISGAFVAIENWRWRSVYLRNGGNGGDKLLIVHRGHDSNPFSGDMIPAALAAGYDVIAMVMPMVHWNGMADIRARTWDGDGLFLGPQRDHALFSLFNTAERHFIGFFVAPVLASIDQAMALSSYRAIDMVGLSGGGWTAVIAAAADARIGRTISVAGALPFFARQQVKDLGDAEQWDQALYRRFPWPVLFQVAAKPNRMLRLIYNSDDPCCFNGASAKVFATYTETLRAIGNPGFEVEIVKSNQHAFDPAHVLRILGAK
jgi:hypothetical protein